MAVAIRAETGCLTICAPDRGGKVKVSLSDRATAVGRDGDICQAANDVPEVQDAVFSVVCGPSVLDRSPKPDVRSHRMCGSH